MNKLPIFEKADRQTLRFRSRKSEDSSFLLYPFLFVVFGMFLVLFIRLFQLTIVKGDYFRRLSENNRIKSIVIEPPRGILLDRKGLTVAQNSNPDVNGTGEYLRSHRTYNSADAIAPLVGYRQLADKTDLENDRCLNKLELGDRVGKKGVEKALECDLRGSPGKKLLELDARGKELRVLGIDPPTPGKTIQLALDLELQKKAQEALKGKKGAVVALKPQTGEILVLASAPTFNPQDFEDNNQSVTTALLSDEDKPLFNRATEGVYPPGSVFKTVLAAGALEEKKIDKDTKFEDTGTIKAGPITFGNWYFLEYGKTEGMLDIVKAIRRSNDIFFYHTGEKLGPTAIKTWAQKFGYGKKTALPLEQAEGIIPSPFWKEEVIKDQWFLGDTYNLSIGQGFLGVTPLQVADATAVFANGGNLCNPQLLKNPSPQCESLHISPSTLGLIREGMKQACSPGGTGWPLFDFTVKDGSGKVRKIQTACKTGTAESHAKSKIPHAWISAFAPYENPEIVVTVLVEEGGQGSDVAGPIAKEVLKTYFERSQ